METAVVDQAIEVIADREGKYLTFALAGEEYGIGILKVKEIIGLMPITTIPQTPGYVKGVINLRGKVIPVADLHHDDAGPVVVLHGLHTELQPEVRDGDHLSPEIDDPLDVTRRLGDGGNRHQADDLLDLQNADTVLLAGQGEGQVLPFPVRDGSDGLVNHCCFHYYSPYVNELQTLSCPDRCFARIRNFAAAPEKGDVSEVNNRYFPNET